MWWSKEGEEGGEDAAALRTTLALGALGALGLQQLQFHRNVRLTGKKGKKIEEKKLKISFWRLLKEYARGLRSNIF